MKTATIVWVVVVVLLIAGGLFITTRTTTEEQEQTSNLKQAPQAPVQRTPSTMQLTSTAFQPNSSIPSQYTCDGNDTSPPLSISGVPEGAQALALIMDDPDAPAGVWDHWVVFNIPPSTTEIPEGNEPQGIHGVGTSGNSSYKGPCPPDREHRYFFKLYALDTTLDLPEGSTKAQVETAMGGHVLDRAELIGLYERS